MERATTAIDPLAPGCPPVRELVARCYHRLTPAERHVADTVLLRPRRAAELSIDGLGRDLTVGTSVISRFCRRLGLVSFRAFQLAIARDLGAAASTTAASQPSGGPGGMSGPAWQAAQAEILGDIAAIHRNLAGLDPGAVEAAADLLAGAARVVTVGYDSSGAVAKRVASMLLYRGWRAHAEVAPTDAIWTEELTPSDLVVAISHRGLSVNLTRMLPAIRARGPRILAITNNPHGPIGRAADVILTTCVPGETSPEAYVLDPIFPVQIVTARALVAAAVAVRQQTGGPGNDGRRQSTRPLAGEWMSEGASGPARPSATSSAAR